MRSYIEKITAGIPLLTPTRRLASHCLDIYGQTQKKTLKVWEHPLILSFEDWLKRCWVDNELTGGVTSVLLDKTQSLLLLERIISHSPQGKLLLSPYQTAKTVYEAWKILFQWRSFDLLGNNSSHIDEMAFQDWIAQYRAHLVEQDYIDEVLFQEHLLSLLLKMSPSALIFYGFEEKTPFMDYFMGSLVAKGWNIEWTDAVTVAPASCEKQAFQDIDEEEQSAILFAKQKYEMGLKRTAIVVPQLSDRRHILERRLKETFDPVSLMNVVPGIDKHFNISAAIPLVNYPLVQLAFTCLRLGLHLSLKEYRVLVDSPWLHTGSLNERYQHYRQIKKNHRGNLNLKIILHYLADIPWRKSLEAFQKKIEAKPDVETFHYWTNLFRTLLKTLNWPANAALSSTEYQTLIRFERLLDELSHVDLVLEKVSYQTALNTLQKMASYVPFQPENKGAPIQVLGLLEAAGQTFDALWVMGMQNEVWPPKATPNPFIDIIEQRKREMPHASADREMNYALKMTERLKQSANEIIFSYSDNPSELIKALPLKENTRIPAFSPARESQLEYLMDDVVPFDNKEPVRATASLLERQSACPFKAFAEFRLRALDEEEKSLWLTPSEKGTIIHRVLQSWWEKFPEQRDFLQLSEIQRETHLEKWIDAALSKMVDGKKLSLHYSVEKSRLQIIFKHYFYMESQREPFSVVKTEYAQEFTFKGLHFHLRCDRIDQDEQQRKYLVDYKTGAFSLKDWDGPRMAAPQMPLYTLAYSDPELVGVKVAQIGLKECKYHGVDEINPNWKIELEKLADEFIGGHATVTPRNPIICQYCHLQSLCRIHSRQSV